MQPEIEFRNMRCGDYDRCLALWKATEGMAPTDDGARQAKAVAKPKGSGGQADGGQAEDR